MLKDGDEQDVGSERDIRGDGFLSTSHRTKTEELLISFEQNLSPLQLLAASALLEWTGKHAYASRKVQTTETVSERIPGLVQMVALEVAAVYLKRFKSIPGGGGITDVLTCQNALREILPQWTKVIAGSLLDTDPNETNRDFADDDKLRAEEKRVIIPEYFETAALEELIRQQKGVPASQVSQADRAPLTAPAFRPQSSAVAERIFRLWWKPTGAEKGQQLGPFKVCDIRDKIMSGEVVAESKLCPMDVKEWIEAAQILEFSDLFVQNPEEDISDPE